MSHFNATTIKQLGKDFDVIYYSGEAKHPEVAQKIVGLLRKIEPNDKETLLLFKKQLGWSTKDIKQKQGYCYYYLGESLFFQAEQIYWKAQPDKVQEEVPKQAIQLYKMSKSFLEEAIAFKFAETPLMLDEPYFWLGVIAYRQKDITQAISLLKKALFYKNKSLAFQKTKVQILAMLGQIFLEKEEWKTAQKVFKQILEIEPEHKNSLLALGTICEKKLLFKKAFLVYIQALFFHPKDIEIKNRLKHLGPFILPVKKTEEQNISKSKKLKKAPIRSEKESLHSDQVLLNFSSDEKKIQQRIGLAQNLLYFAKQTFPKEYERLIKINQTIWLQKPSDFYEKFPHMANALYALKKYTWKKQPLSEELLNQFSMVKFRNQTGKVALPESIKTILRYDQKFPFWFDGSLFTPFFEANQKGTILSQTVEQCIRDSKLGEYLTTIPKNVPLWNQNPSLPALIELASTGDQRIFLYLGKPDENGEYPIARFDDEPCVWITEASLIHLVIEYFQRQGISIQCKIPFQTLLKQAKKRNRMYEKQETLDLALEKYFDSLD